MQQRWIPHVKVLQVPSMSGSPADTSLSQPQLESFSSGCNNSCFYLWRPILQSHSHSTRTSHMRQPSTVTPPWKTSWMNWVMTFWWPVLALTSQALRFSGLWFMVFSVTHSWLSALWVERECVIIPGDGMLFWRVLIWYHVASGNFSLLFFFFFPLFFFQWWNSLCYSFSDFDFLWTFSVWRDECWSTVSHIIALLLCLISIQWHAMVFYIEMRLIKGILCHCWSH